MGELIRTENLAVGYGNRIVVGDISFSLQKGKILTLIGPNGSGKSTILKSITRQIKNLGGAVYLDGEGMNGMTEGQVAKQLSMVMTERIRAELMTCRDVVATGRYPYTGRLGILSGDDWKRVDKAIDMVDAKEVSDKLFTKISDGQKQRIMLARAICQDTKVMILDEPTSYLDMRYKLDILNHIRKLAVEKKLAVVMSLHELDLAQKVSDYIACVEGDHIGKLGSSEEIFRGNYIQKLYGIDEKGFDPVLGTMNLPAYDNEPECFVIAGGGSGIPIYQRLWREKVPFATGILSKNDIDYSSARALSSKMICTEAFYPIEDIHIEQAKELIRQCKSCICTLKSFGPYNQANKILKEYAKTMGKLNEM